MIQPFQKGDVVYRAWDDPEHGVVVQQFVFTIATPKTFELRSHRGSVFKKGLWGTYQTTIWQLARTPEDALEKLKKIKEADVRNLEGKLTRATYALRILTHTIKAHKWRLIGDKEKKA